MANPTELAQGFAEQVEGYLEGIEQAMAMGDIALATTLEIQQGTNGLYGEGSVDLTVLQPSAERLVRIVGNGVQMLQGLVDAGVIEVPEGPFALTAVEPLAIGAGEADADDSGDPEADTDPADGTPNPAGNGQAGEAAAGGTELEVSQEARSRQVLTMTNVFGHSRYTEITELPQSGMAYFGTVVEALYLQLPLSGRNANNQSTRAKQFKDVLAGMETDELVDKYGITLQGVKMNLEKAAKKVISEHLTKDDLLRVFDRTIATIEANS